MDANTYTDFRKAFEAKAADLSSAELSGGLDDIRETMAIVRDSGGGYRNPVSGMSDYEQKLFLERDAFVAEQQKRNEAWWSGRLNKVAAAKRKAS